MRPHQGYSRRTCPNCGRVFWRDIASDWAYKLRTDEKPPRYFCSWTCMRQAEKQKDARRRLKRAWVDVDPEVKR